VRRDQQIQAIVDVGRRTRTATPRWVWIAATLVGAACATGFAVAMLGAGEPAPPGPREPPGHAVAARPASGAGSGVGLAVGAGAALVVGAAIARQRRNHSSRSSP
jgi:hypothetical protein